MNPFSFYPAFFPFVLVCPASFCYNVLEVVKVNIIPDDFTKSVQSALHEQARQAKPIWNEIAEQNQKRDDAILKTAKIIESIRKDLQQTRQQMSDQLAEYDKNRKTDALQRIKDKRQSFRHDFYVAAFSVAFTILVERFSDIVAFFQNFIGKF